MDSYEYSELIKALAIKVENIAKIIRIDEQKARLAEIVAEENAPNFWNDTKKVAQTGKEKSRLNRILSVYENAKNALNDSDELFALAGAENDSEMLENLFAEAPKLEHKIKQIEIEIMLSDKNDSANAIISIQPGAGGTESQDWASMLYRMYLRWC